MLRRVCGLLLLFLLILVAVGPVVAGPPAAPSDEAFVVNSTADPGPAECSAQECTLRAAILAVNASPDGGQIRFNIPGEGPHTIAVASRLPQIIRPVHIDGTSQPGYDGLPLIELNGGQALDSGHGLHLTGEASGSSIEGLALTEFRLNGIYLILADRVMVRHNHIGVSADGVTPEGNRGSGLTIVGGSNNLIADNIIAGNRAYGISLMGVDARDNTIARNYIGTNPNRANLGNGSDGILAMNSGPQIIGGTYLEDGCCEGNVIAYNEGNGVVVTAGGNASYEKGILGNRIYANGRLGIDLQRDGVTPNDPDDSDGDGLANRLQNFPVLEAAHVDGGIVITGTLTSLANAAFRIEFFANDACDPSGHGQGQRYLGGIYATSDAAGAVAFAAQFAAPFDPVSGGDFIASTATDSDGNTSEFSACIQAGGDTAQGPSLIYLPLVVR